MKKYLLVCLLACSLLLAGCGNLFSAEYYISEPYESEQSPDYGGTRELKNYSALKSAIMEMVQEGAQEESFRFGSYSGSVLEDLAAVCHEVKTATPMGAYAVESIGYDTSRIVSYYTADIKIKYKVSPGEMREVVSVGGVEDFRERVYAALDEHASAIKLRVNSEEIRESFIKDYIRECYYADPFLMAMLPDFTVRSYPESGAERIYVVELDYSLSKEKLREMETAVSARASEMALSLGRDSPLGYAVRCADSLAEMCFKSTQISKWPATAYGCLVDGSGDSVAMAMGYKALCDNLDIPCHVVVGNRNGDGGVHGWNIVYIYGEYYHMDASTYYYDARNSILLSDRDMARTYSWDMDRYPACSGPLGPENVFLPVHDDPKPSESPELPPSPSPSESPELPVSPSPSESPELSPSPSPSESPELPVSPKPSESPEVSWSPAPSLSPVPSESPAVSWSPAPSLSPVPSESPAVSWSPAPSLSPIPDDGGGTKPLVPETPEAQKPVG